MKVNTKKVPSRKCVACGKNSNKSNLIRVVKNNENNIFVDRSGRANGRGVYICNNKECIVKVIKNKDLDRSFKTNVKKEIYDELEDIIR